jgi:hypothetical protein
MMWTEIKSIYDAPPIQRSLKQTIAERSEHTWLITSDEGEPLFVAGLFRPSVLFELRLVWFYPYPALRAIHLRGIKKMLQIPASRISDLGAEVDLADRRAVSFAKHLGFKHVATVPSNIGVFRWQTSE